MNEKRFIDGITVLVIAIAMMAMVQTAAAQPPAVVVKGNVTFACNGSVVPDGWNVSWNVTNVDYAGYGAPWNTTTKYWWPCYRYSKAGSAYSSTDTIETIVHSPDMVWTGVNITTCTGNPTYNNITVSEATTPITNVTAPDEPSPIPSGWPLNWTNANVTLTFNRTDTGTGVNWTNYSKTAATGPWTTVNATTATGTDAGNVSGVTAASFNVTVSDEGSTTIWYYSVDKNVTANEETPHKNLTVGIDTTEPIITSITLHKYTLNASESINISVSATDELSDVANVTADGTELEQNGNIWNGTILAASTAGLHNVSVIAKDYANNTAEDNTKQYTVLAPYGVELTVDGVVIATNITKAENATYTLIVRNIGTNNDSYNLTVTNPNNAEWCGLGDDLNVSLTTANLTGGETMDITLYVGNSTDGVFLVNVTATSVANSSLSDYINTTTTIDGTLPIIDLSSRQPANNSNITDNTPTISVNYSDALSGIDTSAVTMTVDGSSVTPTIITTANVSYTPTTALSDDTHTVTVNIADNATNTNTTTWSFRVDTQAPTFEINFATNFPLNITNLTINVNEQLLAGAPTVAVTNESGSVANTTLDWTYPTWTGSYNIPSANSSNYTITVTGTDLAGNAGESVAYSNVTYTTYTVDTETSVPATPPNTTVNITSNGTVAAGVTVTKMEERPPDTTAPAAGIESAGIYIDIDAEQSLVDAVSWVNITICYNKSDIPAGVPEETLRIYYYNGTGWERYDYPDGGVDTTAKYVWANLQHLSTFAVMGVGDTTPPTVAGTPTGTGIAITTTISATFSEAMNQASAQAAFSISPSVSGAFSWVGNTMTFTPSANLAYSTTYTVTIATTATDAAGNPLSLKTWTFTTASEYVPRPGGGARVVTPPINVPVDPTTGEITSTTSLTVEKATLTIPAGIIVKDAAGNPLATSITTMHTPSTAKTVGAIAAYDFGPSGTTFSKPIDLVISYDPAEIPAGFSESDLVVKMYDGTAKAWIDLDTSVDTAAHTATARVSHFSIFALFAAPPVAPPPVTPTPIPTVPPVVTPAPTPIPPVVPPAKLPWGLIIGIIVAVIIVGAAAYYFYTKKKT